MLNKFVSIKVDDQNIFGIETDKGVIDLTSKNSEWKSLYDVVKNNGFDKLISSIDDSELIVPKGSYEYNIPCLLYTSPSPRDQRGSGMPGCG